MSLFPHLSENFYVDNDSDVLRLMDYTYAKNITINQSLWSEADTDLRFVAGDQNVFNDIYGNLPAFRRKQFSFNRIRRIINMIGGFQRQHRKSTVVTPIESGDDKTADQLSKVLFHINSTGNVLNTISEAFEGALKTGMNLLSVWLDYRTDPVSPDIRVDNVAYNAYMIDPYFKKMDLSDCNNLWTRKYLSREMVSQLLPGREIELKNMRGYGNRDGKFQFQPESYSYAIQDLLIYDEFWYLTTRSQKMLVDTQTGESIEWKGNDEDLKEFLNMYRQVVTVTNEIPTVKLAIVVQGKVMYHGPNPMGIDKYPFVPVWAYYEPSTPSFPYRIQGVARQLRDAQYLYNRRKVIELDILESQINSGWKYKEDALINPKDVYLTGQGRGLALKSTAQMTDVEQIMAPQVPPSMIQLSELLAREIQEVSGVNEELLGSAVDDKAGILSMLRQGAGLTTLQILFDQLDFSQKMLGGICLDLMQKNFMPGKIKRIIREEPTDEFYSRAFLKYDCVVEEGLNTSTQKQMQFAQMVQLKQIAPELISAEDLLEAATIQNKSKVVENAKKREESAAQMQQQQQQMQIEVLKAQIEDLKSRAMANEGLGMERASRIHENQALAVERRAQAEKDLEMGDLDKIKAIKELASLDLDQLQKGFALLQSLNLIEQPQAGKLEAQQQPQMQ